MHSLNAVLRRLFRIGGVDDDLAVIAFALAAGADAGLAMQSEVDDAALAGRHGIHAEGLTQFADALRGHLRGEFELGEARGAIFGAIKVDEVVALRVEVHAAEREILDGEEKLSIALEEQGVVAAFENDMDLGRDGGRSGRGGADLAAHVELHLPDHELEEGLELRDQRLDFQFPVFKETMRHDLEAPARCAALQNPAKIHSLKLLPV